MAQKQGQPKIAWGITGAGHFLAASLECLVGLAQVDVFLSKAGKEVLYYYGWYERLTAANHALIPDAGASSLPVTGLYTGQYDLVVIAPATANTIAKMACGIADNLITNLFAHAGKCRIPAIILPCDAAPQIQSITPEGSRVAVYTREIDRKNIACLADWDLVTLADSPETLRNLLRNFLQEDHLKG
jgi:dihydromethanopterin reductase (acceptor)